MIVSRLSLLACIVTAIHAPWSSVASAGPPVPVEAASAWHYVAQAWDIDPSLATVLDSSSFTSDYGAGAIVSIQWNVEPWDFGAYYPAFTGYNPLATGQVDYYYYLRGDESYTAMLLDEGHVWWRMTHLTGAGMPADGVSTSNDWWSFVFTEAPSDEERECGPYEMDFAAQTLNDILNDAQFDGDDATFAENCVDLHLTDAWLAPTALTAASAAVGGAMSRGSTAAGTGRLAMGLNGFGLYFGTSSAVALYELSYAAPGGACGAAGQAGGPIPDAVVIVVATTTNIATGPQGGTVLDEAFTKWTALAVDPATAAEIQSVLGAGDATIGGNPVYNRTVMANPDSDCIPEDHNGNMPTPDDDGGEDWWSDMVNDDHPAGGGGGGLGDEGGACETDTDCPTPECSDWSLVGCSAEGGWGSCTYSCDLPNGDCESSFDDTDCGSGGGGSSGGDGDAP